MIAAGVLFFASAIRTTFGFGEALFSVPLLALFFPVRVAAPVAVLTSIVIAGYIIARDWRHIHLRSAGWLILSTLFGLPFGLVVLKTLPEPLMKSLLAALLLCFSLYSLRRQKRVGFRNDRPALENDRFAWVFGFSAGVLGGSYGLNGPPLAIYGSLRRWSPEKFRATLQAYFLPASALGMCGYGFSGLWTGKVNSIFLGSLPAIVLGILAGRILSRKIEAHRFDLFIHVVLVVIAVVLLAQSLPGAVG